MLVSLRLITPLLALAAPLASGMPHSLDTTAEGGVFDARDGDWRFAGFANAALGARQLGQPRTIALNPKNQNFAQSATSMNADRSTSKRSTTTTSRKTTTTTTTKSTTKSTSRTITKTTTTSVAKTTTTSKSTTTTRAVAPETVPASPTTTTVGAATTTRVQTVRTATASYFTQDGQPGACGVVNSDSTPIVALDSRLYGDPITKSKYCGRTITITNPSNGNTVVALVQDVCVGCPGKYALTLSTGAFDQLGPRAAGVLNIEWHFNPLGSELPSSQVSTTTNVASASPTTTAAVSPSSVSSASASPTSSAPASVFTGQATFFFQDGQAGACGYYNPDKFPLVALDSRLYGNMNAVSKYCNKFVTITNTANGKSVVAKVQDACPGCATKYSLDLSTGAFDAIGDRDTGILPITWYFNS